MSLMTWPDMDDSLLRLGDLLEQRLILLRHLVESLESSRLALAQNDVEAIARGAAHQAELCRHWSLLEERLRHQSATQPVGPPLDSPEGQHCTRLNQEWTELETRIRRLTRVHWSLLRHMQRSAAILARVIESCAVTYTPEPGPILPIAARMRAGE